MSDQVHVTVYSDYICPFCQIGRSRLDQLTELHPELEIQWRPFEIHPETPPEGRAVEGLFPSKYLEMMRLQINKLAEEAGVKLATLDRLSNSHRAHALAQTADELGLAEAYHPAVLNALWEQGRDIGSEDVLLEIWESIGGNEELARKTLAQAASFDVKSEALELGLRGVPTFIFTGPEGKRIVVGAQPLEVLQQALALVSGTTTSEPQSPE